METSSLSLALGDMDLSQEERLHLVSLVESNLHHTILDAVLSELSEEDKKIFLHHVAHNEHDRVWELLNKKVENIEEKIKNAAESLKKELHKDIEDARSKS
ncbi:MAG: hypothetical protein HYV39_01870 [Candidatus Levybacteria bacterium]|nr:hypothetical protein [Candidatus Levybacteria bacterium]